MKIYIGADHGGYNLKEELKRYLVSVGHEVEDMGAATLDMEDDYPDFVVPVALRLSLFAQGKLQSEQAVGIVIGRSGNGEAIIANKVKGIRAALCLNENMARLARADNDANILALGADFVDSDTAKRILELFLKTPFSNEERHTRRIKKVTYYESARSS